LSALLFKEEAAVQSGCPCATHHDTGLQKQRDALRIKTIGL
jgi:hypothetical protein